MTDTDTPRALFALCLEDLHGGKTLLAGRVPALVAAVRDADLRAMLAAEADRAAGDAERLAAHGFSRGPDNLWMAGILDDAARDVETIARGAAGDVAMAGAIRKGKAAEVAAWDTALALARKGDGEAIAAAEAMRRADKAADRELLRMLVRIAGGV